MYSYRVSTMPLPAHEAEFVVRCLGPRVVYLYVCVLYLIVLYLCAILLASRISLPKKTL